MHSQWDNLKGRARHLRRNGKSLREIEDALGIPRSTLQGWCKDIVLTAKQKQKLNKQHQAGLVRARALASLKHQEMRQERVRTVRARLLYDFSDVIESQRVIEVGLAMLYLGEGRKAEVGLGLGNSNPAIMRFYVQALRTLYGVSDTSLRVELHLRDDQDDKKMIAFWSRAINVPRSRFKYVLKDKRTLGKPTYPTYKGVCFVSGGGVEIQRRLLYLAEMLVESTGTMRG